LQKHGEIEHNWRIVKIAPKSLKICKHFMNLNHVLKSYFSGLAVDMMKNDVDKWKNNSQNSVRKKWFWRNFLIFKLSHKRVR
jgi:hypothetical protein